MKIIIQNTFDNLWTRVEKTILILRKRKRGFDYSMGYHTSYRRGNNKINKNKNKKSKDLIN